MFVIQANELSTIIEKAKRTSGDHSHLVTVHSRKQEEAFSFFSEEPGILFVLNGQLDYQIGDDQFRTLSQGEYLFYPKGVTVHIEVTRACSYLVISLTKKLVESFVRLLEQYRSFSPEKLQAPARVCIMQAKWPEHIETHLTHILINYIDQNDYLIHLKLCEILYYLFPDEHMLSKISYILDMFYYPEPIRKMESFLLENYHKPIRIKSITESVNMSESQVNRLYKKYVDMSPMERLTTIRMEQAALLLRNPSVTVTDVASQVGYQSMSAFVQQFKRRYKKSPKDYQKK
ncbi:response regulator receiver [Halalkalibacter wakoensis JCM 9140]|uniref:Response regulator receiver n=1 Tax=Halalkalibacter wakoensis JCM 9140 TaxID=1236970 RepID=W4Q6S7_9BACI|nr:AraC family transcriptional regulator [Halalkalibacter wakoensis]GAE27069.1 response regulator receiver [Halalkalibacter wakoensis JCM 9140]